MNDILKDVEELKELILSSDEYKNYSNSLKDIESKKEINSIIDKIVLLQKEIVKKEVLKEDTSKQEKELDTLYNNLYNYDEYTNYINNSKELNILITSVQKRFEEYFNSLVK